MKSSRRLGPIAKLAKQRERNAASYLGDSLRQADLQQKQLDELINYRDEYVAGFKDAGKAGLSSVQLRDYQVFLSRLDSAIQQQQQKLVASRHNCQQSQAQWQDEHGHSKMIDKAVEKRRQAENRRQDELEQREQDDRPRGSVNTEDPKA
jgi:flagellar FliJ protein